MFYRVLQSPKRSSSKFPWSISVDRFRPSNWKRQSHENRRLMLSQIISVAWNIANFPECVYSKGSGFTLGSGGWGCLRSTLRNRSQPSAWGPYGHATIISAKKVTFGGFTCRVASFRMAGVALRDIQTCFVACRKSFCVVKMRCSFRLRGRRSTLETSVVILCGGRSTLYRRVALRVFCESHCQGCVKRRQGANSGAGVAFCVMRWKLTEASRETLILR